jgi:hypothetical protein
MCERRHREPHDTIILLPGFTASSYIAAGSRYRAAVLTSVPTMIAMILRERFDRGSHRTRRWREMDSNPRSPSLDTHPLTALTPSPGNRRSTDQPRRSSAIICTNHHVSGAAEPQHWRHSRSS